MAKIEYVKMTWTNSAVATAEALCRRDGDLLWRVAWTQKRTGLRCVSEPLSPSMARSLAYDLRSDPQSALVVTGEA